MPKGRRRSDIGGEQPIQSNPMRWMEGGMCWPTCVQRSISFHPSASTSLFLPIDPNRAPGVRKEGRGKSISPAHVVTISPPALTWSLGVIQSQSRVVSQHPIVWPHFNLHRVSLGPAPGPYCASAGGPGARPAGGKGRPKEGGPARPFAQVALCTQLSTLSTRQNPSRMLFEANTNAGGLFIPLKNYTGFQHISLISHAGRLEWIPGSS